MGLQLVLAALLYLPALVLAKADKPNIVLLLADDVRMHAAYTAPPFT